MRKIRLIVFGFVFGSVVMFFVMPELLFEEHTIDLWNGVASSDSSSVRSDSARDRAVVTKVVDGDTIDIRMENGRIERVRLVGIDTPEIVAPKQKVQCYGFEASALMKVLLDGKTVTLERKPDENKDKYGRLLRYVFLDGEDIGARMLTEGYAESICDRYPHPKCEKYDALERAAMTARVGKWGACWVFPHP